MVYYAEEYIFPNFLGLFTPKKSVLGVTIYI